MGDEFLDRKDQTWYRTIRLHPSGHSYEKAAESPEMPLGQSRIGGPVVDLPPGFQPPDDLFFVAQLDLAWLGPADSGELLPDNRGFLYFFFNLFVEEAGIRQVAKVHYFPGAARQLRRTVREHTSWFWRGTTLVGCTAEQEFLADRFGPDGRWDYFAGVGKTKISGYPSNPQWDEEDVARALAGDERFLLLQVGEDVTESGCLCYFIGGADCYHRRFDDVEAVWGQT